MDDQPRASKVLVLGAGGMLGSAVFRFFSADAAYQTFGTLRSPSKLTFFSAEQAKNIICNVDVENDTDLHNVIVEDKPDIVINCVGIIKQLDAAKNHLTSLSINSMLPHRLAQYCATAGARLVHLSTDCVFSGARGMYLESDFPDANDFYGRSKLLGEVDYPHAVTLRTSFIGHELDSTNSLISWFLSQDGVVKGYRNVIFSGMPTVEIARIIRDFVLPNPDLHGVYHLSVDPIDKFELLALVAHIFEKSIEVVPDETVIIDRSLDSSIFRKATGFEPDSWPNLIDIMRDDTLSNGGIYVRR